MHCIITLYINPKEGMRLVTLLVDRVQYVQLKSHISILQFCQKSKGYSLKGYVFIAYYFVNFAKIRLVFMCFDFISFATQMPFLCMKAQKKTSHRNN